MPNIFHRLKKQESMLKLDDVIPHHQTILTEEFYYAKC
jgi:hypothetical protein